MNLAKNLENSAGYFPDRPAIIEGNRSISFKGLDMDASRVASALAGLGCHPGDYICICASNSYEWVTIYYGILKAGCVPITLAKDLRPSELIQIMNDARPKILFTSDEKLQDLGGIANLGYLEYVISNQGDISYQKLVEGSSSDFKAVDRDRTDTAAILYSGGTTGLPKGIMLTHENLMTSIHNIDHFERSTNTDMSLCFLPYHQAVAQIHITGSSVYTGGCVVIQDSFNLGNAIDAIEQYNVTKFYAVPTIYVRFLAVKNIEERLKSLRYCFSAAASMAVEVLREWKSRTNLNIYESYGTTETAAMVTYNHYYRHVIGSVGTPVNTVEVQIRDLEGNVVKQGEEGEICICGPSIMKGYLNKPEETRSAFWDNWFRSGDIGVIDEAGYLYVVDRLKDLIITGGENVYPREVEEVLYARPEVEECAVIGLPDREYGERVTAYIVLKQGYDLNPVALKSYLKLHLSSFKVAKEYIKIDELPKNISGKILKRELKKNAINKLKGEGLA